ncbi:ArdC family protein [Hoeflea poritis]|uniref:Zincin-like metallopeptidase domain-containing protein n=1 Tax=Hoeflea poritis TaxID=2993659 RepID=A0ABT4VW57_9HYPH|nr:zincin-like metallopeptidase domain-containing protein [Hoeflea poritis]MDA4848874.1 zincin-like metallopeptidase domain-containing protein [Hoeflea poritis]
MPQTNRQTVYASVTKRIITELEQGRVPWVQPWGTPDVDTPLGLPRNGSTSKAYSGINILILWGAAIENGRRTQNWLTFKQALSLGGCVRKGEKGTTVVYADRFVPKKERVKAAENGDDPQAVAFLKRYTVFNADQCDGLPENLFVGASPLSERDPIPHAEALIEATGADFRIGGDKAFYVPSQDYVQVPPQPAFRAQIDYYRTCFHELGHWTGHETRLARSFKGRFGSRPYAREELVAEMTSAFVCASLAIVPTVRHSDYIATWLDLLREDDRAIFHAASLASGAADFILAFQDESDSGGMAA